jgi:hypothetical protein
MPTLDELEATATAARQAYETERDRLADLERSAVAAIRDHAEIQVQVLTGAGTDDDVDQAAKVMDGAIVALQEVAKELVPDRGKPIKEEPPVNADPPVEAVPVDRRPRSG